MTKLTKQILAEALEGNLRRYFATAPKAASDTQLYKALAITVRDILANKRVAFKAKSTRQKSKQVYYMSMEFLLGRSLKNHIFNLGIEKEIGQILAEYKRDISKIYNEEPDAGLGNGGLGRLAAAYMESLTTQDYLACGFSIKYDFGIFRQKIVDGMQIELADEWLENGSVFLLKREEDAFNIAFGGELKEKWQNGKLVVEHKDCDIVQAVPYDMYISGYNTQAVNKLCLWTAKAVTDFDLEIFSRGQFVKAQENKALAESISKVLYPADDHVEGKALRLKQQYFFVSASMQYILKKHLKTYGNLNSLPEQVAIHINDTHPALCVPELTRLLLDEYGYSWEDAWALVQKTMSYTNHTVMSEALERWPEWLFKNYLPRIYQIVAEINKRHCIDLWNNFPNDWNKVRHNAVIADGQVNMANLCLVASHTVNGVSALHSEILKNDVFADDFSMHPGKYTNVTNGITYRRWLVSANPEYAKLIKKLIGDGFLKDALQLKRLEEFQGDKQVLAAVNGIKRDNKAALAKYIWEANGIKLSPDSIFDVQVKRLHEYKRQLLNALNILHLYLQLKDNPNMDINPRSFIFGAKAAPSYHTAKLIIKFINKLGDTVNNDKSIKDKLKVVFLENYRVTLAEQIMPASEISQQISIAGKEASGTGNMKFMINGAITVGTMDGANVEIHDAVGAHNIFIFGLSADEAAAMYRQGYEPMRYYEKSDNIKRVVDTLKTDLLGENFSRLYNGLLIGDGGYPDPYMVLADFDSYAATQNAVDKAYGDRIGWAKMSLLNTAYSGFFSSDRSVTEYAHRIWGIKRVK